MHLHCNLWGSAAPPPLSLPLLALSPASIHVSAALAFSATQSFISFHRPLSVHCGRAAQRRKRRVVGGIMFHLFSAQDKYDEEALSKWLLRRGRCGATRHNHELLRTLFIVSPLHTAPGYCKVFRSREPQPVLPGRPGVIGGYRGCCAEPPTPNESAPVKSAWCMSVAVCLSSHCLSVASTSRQSRSSHLAHSFVPFPPSLVPPTRVIGRKDRRVECKRARVALAERSIGRRLRRL